MTAIGAAEAWQATIASKITAIDSNEPGPHQCLDSAEAALIADQGP